MDKEWIDCKHIFSNGTEFEIFEENCQRCARYRNEKCRILQACYRAMFDPSEFPYADLLDHVKYGGKRCKSFTTEKPQRAYQKKPMEGQMTLWD